MEGSLSNKLLKVGKAAFYGFLGATAIIHITPLVRPIFKNFEDRFIRERHNEFEIAVLLTVGFLTLIMEPVTYLINLAVTLERHGYIAFMWLAPVAISQSYALIRWLLQRR